MFLKNVGYEKYKGNSMNHAKIDTPSEIIGFQEEIATIQTAIADYESGHKLNVAIISEPFAGRTTVVDQIEKMNPHKVTKLSLSSIINNMDEIHPFEQSRRIVLIDDAQFLYTRKIGGFNVLERFLKSVLSSNNLFITSWNLYSWNYLDEVINIGKYFPVQIKLSKLNANQIKECTLLKYKAGEIKFEKDIEFEKEKIIESRKYPVSIKLLEKTINIPYYKINYRLLKVRLLRKEERVAIEDIIFEKLFRVSNGNPGVAKVVWKKSLEYPIIKPSKIKENSFNIELDYNESFILNIILSMKSIKNEELSEIAGPDFQIEKIIFRLAKQELITINEGTCTIKPEALKSIVDFLKKLRLVW